MQIKNIIKDVYDGKDRPRDWEDIEGAMVHRCGIDLRSNVVLGYDGLSVCNAFLGRRPEFADVARATGGQIAYSILIGGDLGPPEYDGVVWQCLPLDDVGMHARRFGSAKFVGVGLIADCREKPASQRQYNALIELLANFCLGWNKLPHDAIKGHGEVPRAHGGNKAPGRPAACPGDLLNMNDVRADVAYHMKDAGRRHLYDAGLMFE